VRLGWHLEWWTAPIWDLVNEGTANWRVQSAHLPRHHCAVIGSSSSVRPLRLCHRFQVESVFPTIRCWPSIVFVLRDSRSSGAAAAARRKEKFLSERRNFFFQIFCFSGELFGVFFNKGLLPSIAPLIGYSVPILFLSRSSKLHLAFCLFVFSSLGAKSFPLSDYGKLV